MEKRSNGFRREGTTSFELQNGRQGEDVYGRYDCTGVRQRDTQTHNHRKLSQESFGEDWSDYSFYDLPETLRESLHRSMHLSELVTSPCGGSPSYNTVHHMHAYVDPEIRANSPDTALMAAPGRPQMLQSSSRHQNNNSSRYEFRTFEKGSALSSKHKGPFSSHHSPGDLESVYGLPHASKEWPLSGSLSLSTGEQSVLGRSASSRKSHLGQAERKILEREGYTMPFAHKTGNGVWDELKDRTYDAGNNLPRGRDHITKSVSFSTHLEKNGTFPHEEKTAEPFPSSHRAPGGGQSNALKQRQIQSNMRTLDAPAQGADIFQKRLLQSDPATGDEPFPGQVSVLELPQSPPTRDTHWDTLGRHQDPSSGVGSVQLLSLYEDDTSEWQPKSLSAPVQSNLNIGRTMLQNGALHTHTPSRSRQSNATLDGVSNGSLRTPFREDLKRGPGTSSSPFPGFPGQPVALQQEKEQSVDSWLDELSLTNSFSVETSRKISTAVWAMKLMNAEHSMNPAAYQEMMTKARLFRRWFQRTRLRKSLRREEDKKLERAESFWCTGTLSKFFTAWAGTSAAAHRKAGTLCERHLLQKGLQALKIAVHHRRQDVQDFRAKHRGRLMAKYWLKWQGHVELKEKQKLRSAFNRWQVYKLQAGRDKILESIANRHVLSKNYIRWKAKFTTEQRNGVASLHYKICLLTKCWHSWRVHTSQMVVRQRLCEVARVHYEERLQLRVFNSWRQSATQLAVANSLKNRRSVCKAFHCWRSWTQYAKIIHLRFQSMCKEYHRRQVIKQTFLKWRIRLMRRRADAFSSQNLQRRSFKLWFLRHKRKVIHRYLRKAMARKGIKRRFFGKWLVHTRKQKEARRLFVLALERSLVGSTFIRWKEHAQMKTSLRNRLNQLRRMRDSESSRKCMDQWLFAMKVVHFRQRVQLSWSRRCARKACEAWKILLKRKYLEQRLIDSRPMWELFALRKTMRKWRNEKQKVDDEKLKAARAAAILARNCKARALQAWRVVNQEEHIIAPLKARRKRKEMARIFDAWRLHVHRQKHIVDQKSRAIEKILDKYFLAWRERAYLKVKERELTDKLLRGQKSRAFRAWRAWVRKQRHERLRERAHKLQLMQKFYSTWKTKCQQRIEEKEEIQGREHRRVVLLVWIFKWWKGATSERRQKRAAAEEASLAHRRLAAIRTAFLVWLRRYRAEQKAREHAKYRTRELLRKCLLALRTYARDTVQREVMQFCALSLDSSAASAFFRSTLGSTLSDTLSSSGYGDSMRRGSQPVFKLSETRRDIEDDVASLPGRLDQLRPESPQLRPASPISIVRESRPMSPLTYSPSPCGSFSPERQTPDLVFGDNGFSPEEDTGIHSGSSESDHEDDRMSVLSAFSTAARSTQSDVFDRGIILTDTIRHWRSLPLSLAFRSWLKYTRRKKLLKERLYYAQEKKQTELLDWGLHTWRRELYTRVTARQHWLDRSRRTCLRAWHEYTECQRIQEERKTQAQQQWRTFKLTAFFKKWRKKCSSTRKLQSLVKQWREKGTVSQKDKTSTAALQKRQSSRILRQSFLLWAQMTKKSEDAKRHYLDSLTPRCFGAWYSLVSVRVTNRKKVVMFEEHRLLSSAFREWMARFVAIRKAEEFVEVRETDNLAAILRAWHTWANGMSTRRNRARMFRRSMELKQMRQIFSVWLTEARDLGRATRHHQHVVMGRALLQWKDVVDKRTTNKLNLQIFREHQTRNLLVRSFHFWRQLHAHTMSARAHAQQLDQRLMKECLVEWRTFALKRRANKHHLTRLYRKMFLRWYDLYIARKTTRRLLVTWKSRADETKSLHNKAIQICQESEQQLMRRTFNRWVQEAHKVQKAKVHCSKTLKRRAFLSLHLFVRTRVGHRRTLAELQEKRAKQQLSRCLRLWSEYFQRNMRNLDVLAVFLSGKDDDLLRLSMQRWRRFTLKCRAQKFCEQQLVHKKMLYRKTRQAAIHWKRWTVRVKKQATMANDLQAQHGQRLLRAYFGRWVSGAEAVRQARDHHHATVVRRSFSGWLAVSRRRTEERNKVKAFQDERMKRKVRELLLQWNSALKSWQKHKQLIGAQMDKHNRRLLSGAVREWRKFTRKSRANKHYDTFLKAKTFLDWKMKWEEKMQEKQKFEELEQVAVRYRKLTLCKMCFRAWSHDVKVERHLKIQQQLLLTRTFILWKKKLTLNSIASDLSDRRLYEIYWSKWRHQLIRKRVSELMFKHEEKKLVSEVFGAWYHITLVRRRLLKEWRVYKTMQLFRKWMRRYNDS